MREKIVIRKYTHHGKNADLLIDQYLQTIVKEITNYLPDAISVLLVGSFGRGEGSVTFNDAGNVVPLKDFDFLVIFDKKVPLERVKKTEKQMHIKLGNASSTSYAYTSFTIDLNASTLDRINKFPDITTYEAKFASHVMYGKDVRNKITITKGDVPLRSGARILFQKGISLIGQLATLDYIKKWHVPDTNKKMFIYESVKVFVELGTALTILGGIYFPSYEKRASILRDSYKELFPDLHEKFPDLGEKIFYYTQIKLSSDFGQIHDPISLWFSARRYHKIVMMYYIKNYLDVQSLDWSEFCLKTRTALKKEYYKPLFRHIIKKMCKIEFNDKLLDLFSRAFRLCGDFRFLKSKNYSFKRLYVLDFFVATLLLLHSIESDGTSNTTYQQLAGDLLESSSKRYIRSKNESWTVSRQIFLTNLDLVRGIMV